MPIEEAQALRSARLAALKEECAQLWGNWPTELTLEIGCGHGHFLTAYAQAHPKEHCLGVDLLADRIARARKKATRAGLANLAFFHGDAGLLLEALPPAVRLTRVFVLFPDPWPKRRHHKNRILQDTFLQQLAGRAGQGALLCFRTDYEPYLREVEALLATHSAWRPVRAPWPFEFETVFQSRAAAHHSLLAKAARPHP
jgi:tRNA (guanine-N7-)-methyltransferase